MTSIGSRLGPVPFDPPDDAPAADAPAAPQLPEVLLERPRAKVVHGSDAGDFYCEHMFFLAQKEATRTGGSVQRNASGEPLVGFLHVPWDPFTSGGSGKYTQASRHGATREVVGAALRGYYDDAAASVREDPVRLLLTGYDVFGGVKNNPTGDFVRHGENVDAAMRAAFGPALLTKKGKKVGQDALAYRVRDPGTGKERTVHVATRRFAVADATLDMKGDRSIQRAIADFKPHAVISMGVHGGGEYKAEYHADDGGLRQDRGGRFVHDEALGPRTNLPDNRSLARAIQRGGGADAAGT